MLEAGAILIDGQQIASTHKCCHCGGHFLSIKGSGRRRGFCTKCSDVTCGSAECHGCKPFEKKLEEMEKKHGVIR